MSPILLAAWAACANAPPEAEVLAEPAADPVDLQRVEEVLQHAFDIAPTADAYALQDAYDDVMGLQDLCPNTTSGFWYDDCETSSGAHFGGYVIEQRDLEGFEAYWTLYGVATVTRPNGNAFVLGGFAGVGEAFQDDVNYVYSYLYGTFLDEGADGWFAQGYDADITVQAVTHTTGPHGLTVGGSIGWLMGDPGLAVDFIGVAVIAAGWPEQPCTQQPVGEVAVRLSDGTWVDLDFGDACDGCAEAYTLDGFDADRTASASSRESVGMVCVDGSSWLDWEVSPW